MNTPEDEHERIEDRAAEWLAEREEGLSPARQREFDRWCRADPRHAAAIARLEQACALLADLPQVRDELLPVVEFPLARAPEQPAAAPRRIPWARIFPALAALLVLGTLAVWQGQRVQPAAVVHSTSAGGYERVVLADGSVVELNANTEVRVELTSQRRHVALVAGEAHFTVAHDTRRPFVVSAGQVSVRAVGTAFNVRRATADIEVLVTEGKVDVAPASGGPPFRDESSARDGRPVGGGPTLVSANERLVVPAAVAVLTSAPPPGATPPIVEKVSPEVIRAALIWQERKLVFADTPLREVITQFNRRNRLQLILADSSLLERPVGGTFSAENAEGFARLLESSGLVVVERRGEFEIILRAPR